MSQEAKKDTEEYSENKSAGTEVPEEDEEDLEEDSENESAEAEMPEEAKKDLEKDSENEIAGAEVPEDADKDLDEEEKDSEYASVTLLSDRMKNLLKNGTNYDVKICVKDKEFRAHRNILCARSPVFAMIFTHDSEENHTGTIRIEDCDPDSFDEFLLYVYSGKTKDLTPGNALQLYYPADKYDFPLLKQLCVRHMKSSLSVTSICDVILLAVRHGEKELLVVATDYFARNMKEILVTVGWQNFMSRNPVEANELLIKSMDILLPKK